MRVRSIRLGGLLTTTFLVLSFAGTASAQSSDRQQDVAAAQASAGDPAVDPSEIVVTANRRSESVQNVPLSITALSSQALEQRAATSFFDYGTSVPNLAFGTTAEGVSSSRTLAIRGIADKNTTAFYIDDTPVSESLDPKIVDVARIEVLRGPQGTLYGARSMGGAVRLITTQPDADEFDARIHASIATTDHTDRPDYSIDGAANIPVVQDKIGLRVVGLHEYDAGYFTRTYGPQGGPTTTVKNVGRSVTDGASAAMLLKLSDNLSVTPRVLYQKTSYNGFPFADVATQSSSEPVILIPASFDQHRDFNIPESSRDEWYLATLDMKLTTSLGALTSATSYFHRNTQDTEDGTDFIAFAYGLTTPLPAPVTIQYPVREFAQEFRFVSDFHGPFQLVAGLFYSRNSSQRYYPPNIIPGLDAATGGVFGTDLNIAQLESSVQKDYAAYAEGTLEVLNGLKAIAGARFYKIETTSSLVGDGIVLGGPTSIPAQTRKDTGIQPKFSLQYQISPGNQIFATAAKGFRPGGINGVIPDTSGCPEDLAQLGLTAQDTTFYRPDSVWSYEVGAKTTMLDRRLTADASAFRIDWDNIQQVIGLQCGFTFRGNAGKARSQGIELEITARLFEGFSLDAGFGYTDAKFLTTPPGTEFQKGGRVPQVPKYTFTAAADYAFPISESVRGFGHLDYRYVSDSLSVLNSGKDANGIVIPRIRPSYNIIDLRAGVSFGRNEVALFAKNLTNEIANLGDSLAVAAEAPGRARISINQPRTVGVELRSHF